MVNARRTTTAAAVGHPTPSAMSIWGAVARLARSARLKPAGRTGSTGDGARTSLGVGGSITGTAGDTSGSTGTTTAGAMTSRVGDTGATATVAVPLAASSTSDLGWASGPRVGGRIGLKSSGGGGMGRDHSLATGGGANSGAAVTAGDSGDTLSPLDCWLTSAMVAPRVGDSAANGPRVGGRMGLKSSGGAGIGRVHGAVAAAGADSGTEVTPGVAELSPLTGELSLSPADGSAMGPRTGGLFGLKSRVFIRLISPTEIPPVEVGPAS